MDTEHEVTDTPATAITEYSQTAAALATLREQLAGKEWNLTTVAGNAEARQSRKVLVDLRTGLNKMRLALNADDQARIAVRNGEAKRITAEIEALEQPIDEAIKADEARRDAIRVEREEAERVRLVQINERLTDLRNQPLAALGQSAAAIAAQAEQLAALDFADEDDIHGPVFQNTRDEVVGKLRGMATLAKDAEAEADRQAIERAELDRRKAAQDAADAEAAAARAEADRVAQAERDAAAALQQAAMDAQQAELDAQRARIEALLEEQRRAQRAADEIVAASTAAAEEAQRVKAQDEAREAARLSVEQEEAEIARRHEAEILAIQNATLHAAAGEAVKLLVELGQERNITTRKLVSALAREPKPAKAKKVAAT